MGVRDENRERMESAILDAARRQLAESGPAALSLRAVARELGIASSAVYRYVESRDDLLTRLIVAAYDDLGAAVEHAAGRSDGDPLRRWRAAATALRRWGLDHPHDWALVYGSPVPGYAAPQDTVGPASRVPLVLVDIVRSAPTQARPAGAPLTAALTGQADGIAATLGLDAGAPTMTRLAAAWTTLVGTVSFELFGHLVGSFDPADAYWAWLVDDLAAGLGITAPA